MNKHFREHGYILVMTLMLMAIAVLAMAQVSRASLLKAMRAKTAQRELQRRWGVLSCQAAILSQAETHLKQVEIELNKPIANTLFTVRLGEQDFELVISDEQAKANIHTLYQRRGHQTTESNIRSLIHQTTDPLTVRLNPLINNRDLSTRSIGELPILGSFAQIFSNISPAQLIKTDTQSPAATTYFTCWGNGKLNFRRTSQPAIKQLCEGLLTDTQIAQMISRRLESPQIEADEALIQLALTKGKQDQLAELFTNESTCHSLWIITHDGDRSWYRLAVSEASADNKDTGQIYTYAW